MRYRVTRQTIGEYEWDISDLKRFFKKVEKTSTCWLWLASFKCSGYGQFSLNYRMVPAHRFSYVVHTKKDPRDRVIMHTCDDRTCVNPLHLIAVTQTDNTADMISKGRGLVGVKNGRARFKEQDIRDIRALACVGITYTDIAKLYGVGAGAIREIVLRETWGHIL